MEAAEKCSFNTKCHSAVCCISFDVELFPEDFKRKTDIHVEDDGITLKYAGERCPYLDSSNLCSIYDQRPNVCRQYDCCGDSRLTNSTTNLLM